MEKTIMSEPWLDYQQAEEAPPWEYFAKQAPKESAYDLYQKAVNGDPAALEAYNTRARTYGQNTIEQDREQNSPVAGQNFAQNLWQGLGRTLPELSRAFDAPEEVDRQRQIDAPLAQTSGGLAGNITGQLGLTFGPQALLAKPLVVAGKAAPYINAAIVGGAQGALTPVGTGDSRARNVGSAAIWNTGGQAAGDIIGAVGPKVGAALRPKDADLYEQGSKIGFELTPGQITNSRWLKYLSSESQNWPGSGASGIADKQQAAFNNLMLRTVGEQGDVITDDLLKDIRLKNKAMYEGALNGQQIKLDQGSWKAYQNLRQWMPGRVPAEQIKQFDALMKQYGKDIQGGKITGEIYQAIRQELRDMAASEGGKYGEALKQFKGILDDAAERSLPKENLAMYRQADNMYRNFKVIEQSMTRRAGAKGDILPGTPWSLVNKKYKSTPEMRDTARFGANIADTLPQSGTAPRQGVSSLADLLLAPPRAVAGRVANSPILSRYLVNQPKAIEGTSLLLRDAVPRIAAGTAGVAPAYLMRKPEEKKKKK